MLKLIYTESGICLEPISQSQEEWLQTRLTLAQRVGQPLFIEESSASFLLPAHLPGVWRLTEQISLDLCDEDTLEVRVQGIWVSSDPEGFEGVLVTDTDPDLEAALLQLWQDSQICLMA